MILVYTTHPNEAEAARCVQTLLSERLIACANIFPVKSAYWWEGQITTDGECVAILKTTAERWDALEQRIAQIHPYEIPCILRMQVEANASYKAWVAEQVSTDG